MRNKTKKIWWRKNPNVHEHLEFWVKNCSYADRLLWLEQSNEFIRSFPPKADPPPSGRGQAEKTMKIVKR